MARLTHAICNLDGTAARPLIGISDRQLVPSPLKAVGSFTFRLPLAHRHADRLMTGDCLVKAYRDGVLRFIGTPSSGEEAGQGGGEKGTVQINCADPTSILFSRLLGKTVDAAGKGVGIGFGTALAQVDLGGIVSSVLSTLNTEADTGVRIGYAASGTVGYAGPWYFKAAGEAIAELASTQLGFDWQFVPTEPTPDAFGVKLGVLTAAPMIGVVNPKAILQYGQLATTGGRMLAGNCRSYRRPMDKAQLANRVYSLPSGFPDTSVAGDPVVSATDAASVAQYRLREDVISVDLANQAMRQTLVDEHVRVRKVPRRQIILEPIPGAKPRPFEAVNVGDIVPARIAVGGQARFDGNVRLYTLALSYDDAGNESPEWTMVPE